MVRLQLIQMILTQAKIIYDLFFLLVLEVTYVILLLLLLFLQGENRIVYSIEKRREVEEMEEILPQK